MNIKNLKTTNDIAEIIWLKNAETQKRVRMIKNQQI